MNNPFDNLRRTLDLYEKLKRDVENKTSDVLDSLPQFLRMGLIEKETGWYSEINRYDIIVSFAVHGDFPNLNLVGKDIRACNKIKPQKTKTRFLVEHEFLTFPIIDLRGDFFTIQDFILAIAYHGTFHRKTDKPQLEKLYAEFIQKYSEISFRMALEIGECIIDSFQEVYMKFKGNNDAFSSVHGRQPLLDLKVKALLFSNSYMQLPVRAKFNCGIRICLDLKLEQNPPQGFIFSYGHREKDKVIISCEHVPKFLLIKTKSNNLKGLNKIIKIPITDSMKQDFFKLEVALYKHGKLVIGVDEWLKESIQITTSFGIYDGKLVMGADLNGEKAGTFYERSLTLEAINKRNQVINLFKVGDKLLSNFPLESLPSNALKRPAILPARKFS